MSQGLVYALPLVTTVLWTLRDGVVQVEGISNVDSQLFAAIALALPTVDAATFSINMMPLGGLLARLGILQAVKILILSPGRILRHRGVS